MLQTHRYELLEPPQGARWDIVGIVLENERRPVMEYLERDGVDADGFFAFGGILMGGEPFEQMGKRFKKLRHVNNVFQMTVGRDRYLGFRWHLSLILTNGFKKTGSETPPQEIKLSVGLQEKFFEQHSS